MAIKQGAYLTLAIIYISLIMGVILFGVVTIFLLGLPEQPQQELTLMSYIAIIIAIVFPALGIVYYTNKIASARTEPINIKIEKWRVATIVKAALLEAPCLFCVVNIMLSGANLFIYLYVALLVLLIFNFPTKKRVLNDLQLTEDDL